MADVLPFNPSPADMARHVNRLASESSGNVILTDHAKERMQERNVTFKHIITCLQKGRVIEGPYLDLKGCWKCTMVRAVSGLEITVVTAVDFENKLIVVTTY